MKAARDAGAAAWYMDAVIYELHVRAFKDSKGDGFGDFRGLTEKLGYLQDLGVTAVWLLPFFPSPLRDDGYDTSDYMDVLPDYGTLADFREFLREAHERDIRVITEMVVNHTSDRHPWFQRARRAKPGSRYRNYYVWNDSADRYPDARIIFKDFERSNWTWDPEAKSYYWHRFFSHQPDLNFDNPAVHKELLRAIDFWFDMGVDGLRLDAVPYLYERDGTNCENLPETHDFLKKLRRHVDSKYPDKMLLAEANQWPEDAVRYFGVGDECHMAFHFPLMPRLFMALHQEDRFPILDILEQTPAIPDACRWAIFLRNHDELTLEMVTEEERNYMWQVYARETKARINLGIRRRLAPLLGNSRRRIELMNALLFSLPGTPVIYYGDEIGMGDNIHLGDRNGVRTPMQWSNDRNAGFSSANPQKLYLPVVIDPEYHYEAVNVEAQHANTSSMLWWMKRIIALRKRHAAFSSGTIEFIRPTNRRILAFLRRHHDDLILVVANLSRYAQFVELDMPECRGRVPIELFGNVEFPKVTEKPYLLSLGPHSFFWFRLAEPRASALVAAHEEPPIDVKGSWREIFEEPARDALEQRFITYLPAQRWFRAKSRSIIRLGMHDVIPWNRDGVDAALVILHVEYREGDAESYMIPVSFSAAREAERMEVKRPGLVVARLSVDGLEGLLYDTSSEPHFAASFLRFASGRVKIDGGRGVLRAAPEPGFNKMKHAERLHVRSCGSEQSNTTVMFGEAVVLKYIRKIEEGISPELELGRRLAKEMPAGRVPPLVASVDYRVGRDASMTVAVLHGYVPNEGDAWSFTLDNLDRFIDNHLSGESSGAADDAALIGPFLDAAKILGVRTAELHLALTSTAADATFAPEPFTPHYQRSLFQSLRNLSNEVMRRLESRCSSLGADEAAARAVLRREREITRAFRAIIDGKITAQRIRNHGDLHLGQVLYTGRDFVIMDFEGEPARSLNERRLKRSPIRDVAGMIRSFSYAGYVAIRNELAAGHLAAESERTLRAALRALRDNVVDAYLHAYLETAGASPFMPKTEKEFRFLLQLFLLEKAVYELGYELDNRPDWAGIPLAGILAILDGAEERS